MVHLTKGCGITSEGYLILEPADVDLVAVRPYTLPLDHGYPPFVDAAKEAPAQFPLWELLDDEDEAGAVPLTDPLLGLSQKAVVLFLELRMDGLRNCAPNNCDDRGAQVTATLRRLLVDVADLDKLIAATPSSSPYLGADLAERLQLPDLRMPRFDVPSTLPVQTAQVLQAFQETFRVTGLAAAHGQGPHRRSTRRSNRWSSTRSRPTRSAASSAGSASSTRPPSPPGRCASCSTTGTSSTTCSPPTTRCAGRGVDLLCACCPPADLFPRHLMVGVIDTEAFDAAHYRQRFVRSPAVGDCSERSGQVRQLFLRLVEMVAGFSESAPQGGVKVTPSRWGDVPASAKAIPFYYRQDATPPLYELWDPARTARRRANLNLGYRSDEYVPAAPAFVTDPLRYDLEPNNFLRIEGHVGRDVQSVVKSLLSVRRDLRVPFEVVALRTGAFDENAEVDLRNQECRFRDLETLYDTLRAELECFLVKQIRYFYALQLPAVAGAPRRWQKRSSCRGSPC